MTVDELLDHHPRETLRWLRGRLGLSQLAFARQLGVNAATMSNWETRRHGIADAQRPPLAALLAPHLATDEGHAFVRSLGGEGGRGAG